MDPKEESISTEKKRISFRQNGESEKPFEANPKRGEIEHPNTIYGSSVVVDGGDGLCFFPLDCPFWRPKIGNPRKWREWSKGKANIFLVEANFVLFHFSSHPHKNSEKVMDFLYFYYRQVDGFAPTFSTKPTIRQDTDGSLVFHCSILADPRPVVTWFHNGDKIQDNKKFQVSRNSLLSLLSSRYLLGKHLTF